MVNTGRDEDSTAIELGSFGNQSRSPDEERDNERFITAGDGDADTPTSGTSNPIVELDDDSDVMLGHAEESEAPVEAEKPVPPPSIGFFQLFRFATGFDVFLMILGSLGAAVTGIMYPAISLVFGQIIDGFNEDNFMERVTNLSLTFVAFAAVSFVSSYLAVALWLLTSERQSKRLREAYLAALLSQEVGWHDLQESGNLAVKLTSDTRKFQNGVSEKVALVIQAVVSFFAGLGLALYKGWELTLVVLATAPVLGICGAVMGYTMTQASNNEQTFYGKAGAVAQETLTAIRTVVGLSGERFQIDKYTMRLREALAAGKRKGWLMGAGSGAFYLVIFVIYGFGFWYGGQLIIKQKNKWGADTMYTGGDVVTIFTGIIMGVMGSAQAAPHFADIASARGVAITLYETIDRVSKIDSLALPVDDKPEGALDETPDIAALDKENEEAFARRNAGPAEATDAAGATTDNNGSATSNASTPVPPSTTTMLDRSISRYVGRRPQNVIGQLTFENVSFRYPSRPEMKIIDNLNLTIEAGTTVALVGASGCGKSTMIQLVERFYDPEIGRVLVDGVDLRTLNPAAWRQCIGLVAQEPVLFSGSVADNIRYGKPDATQQEIVTAAKLANAHDFIMKNKDQYNTDVGENGRLLSGGQKQRVAIARALIKDPRVLLFDEATSALDTESERVVQAALDKLLSNKDSKRTTLIIAHRLSTIRNADRIIVFDAGIIVEDGNHDSLLAKNGHYAGLVNAQDEIESKGVKTAQITSGPKSPSVGEIEEEEEEEEKKMQDKSLSRDPSDGGLPSSTSFSKSSSSVQSINLVGKDLSQEETKVLNNKGLGLALRRLGSYFSGNYIYLFTGILAGMGEGASFPVFSLFLGSMITSLYEDAQTIRDTTGKYFLYFALVGIASGICSLVRGGLMNIAGENMVFRARKEVFTSLLRQDIEWHDDTANSPGILATKLAADAGAIRSVIADKSSIVLSVSSNIIVGFTIAFVKGWQMALVMLALFPVLASAGAIQMKLLLGAGSTTKKAIERAGQLATESVMSLRTMASFNGEHALAGKFSEVLEVGLKVGTRTSHLSGLGFGAANAILFLFYALSFWFGGEMVKRDNMTFEAMLQVFMILEMAAMMSGQLFQVLPDLEKMGASVNDIFDLLELEPVRNYEDMSGLTPDISKGEVTLENVHFHYPKRPDVPVLQGLDVTVKGGQVIAFVGESGSGKSTVFGLIQRFYDPAKFGSVSPVYEDKSSIPEEPENNPQGRVLFDGYDLRTLRLVHLRRLIGIVGQEPVLFTGTIAENVRFGDDTITQEQIVEACKQANVHDLIMKRFKFGYDTQVGAKGSQLSGGQKQRVAIARAIVRKPKILLLDEATSALDSKSEALVQEALERVMVGRTTIVIAHRLSTIRNADAIVVVGKGKVLEGPATHHELVQLGGAYAKLAESASLSAKRVDVNDTNTDDMV